MKILIIYLTVVFNIFIYNDLTITNNINTDAVILAELIHSECSICTEEEKRLVGSSVLNRMKSEQFPNSIKKVAYQSNQYHGMFTSNKQYSKETYNLAVKLLDDDESDIELNIYYFFNSNSNSYYNIIDELLCYYENSCNTIYYHDGEQLFCHENYGKIIYNPINLHHIFYEKYN